MTIAQTELAILGNLDSAYESFLKMEEIIEAQKNLIGQIVASSDEDYADKILGYTDRVIEILMDLQELKIPKPKGE